MTNHHPPQTSVKGYPVNDQLCLFLYQIMFQPLLRLQFGQDRKVVVQAFDIAHPGFVQPLPGERQLFFQ